MARTRVIGGILTVVVNVAGCGDSAVPVAQPSSTARASSVVVSPSAGPSAAAATAAWVRPEAKAVIKTTDLELAATAVRAASVAFRVEAADGSVAGCRSTKPAKNVWSCTIDLLDKGIVPGALTASFDVEDRAGLTLVDLAPERAISYRVAPPMPATKYTVLPDLAFDAHGDTGIAAEIDKVTWTSPAGYATEFRLYGVIGCLNESARTDGDPCVVERMSLPAKSLELIKKVGGGTRSITLTNRYTASESCGVTFWCGTYGALVLSAYNDYGHSRFAIVAAQDVCWMCGP
jgi:hypothetical protein